jgi:hypothetical protein
VIESSTYGVHTIESSTSGVSESYSWGNSLFPSQWWLIDRDRAWAELACWIYIWISWLLYGCVKKVSRDISVKFFSDMYVYSFNQVKFRIKMFFRVSFLYSVTMFWAFFTTVNWWFSRNNVSMFILLMVDLICVKQVTKWYTKILDACVH